MTRWQIVWYLVKLIFRRGKAELPQELQPALQLQEDHPVATVAPPLSPQKFDPVSRKMVRR
jgi:hypothetical protein